MVRLDRIVKKYFSDVFKTMDKDDLKACKISDKKWQCPVTSCQKVLSRQQTLQIHLRNSHNIEAGPPTKKYKLYEIDSSIPVPKSTKYAHMRMTSSGEAIEMQPTCSAAASSTCVEPDDVVIMSSSLEENISNTTFLGDDSDMDIDSETCESDTTDSDVSQEDHDNSMEHVSQDYTDLEDSPLYIIPPSAERYSSTITKSEHVLAMSAFSARHNLSDTAIKHLLRLGQLLIPEKNIGETSIYELKNKCGFDKTFLTFNFFCDICKKNFSELTDSCKTPDCPGIKTDQQNKKYFVTSNIKLQLCEILQRKDMWSMLQHSKCSSPTETISDISSGSEYKKLKQPGGFLHGSNNLTLSMFTDGVPLFKSSGVQIWPVYLLINEIPAKERFSRKNMLLWGIWQGRGKPKMNMFLKPLILDLIDLYNMGVSVMINQQQMQIKCMLVLATMDLPARAYVTGMTHHNGEYGCLYCEEPGTVVESGAGTCRSYNVLHQPANLRTEESTKEYAKLAHTDGKNHKGFLGLSVLHFLPYFSLTNNILIDYMHGTLLGITKKLLELWFDSKFKDTPHYIGDKIEEVDQMLKGIKPPYMVHRHPRILSNTYYHWKASELRNWLLFYCIPCLESFLPKIYLDHISCLVAATYILLCEGISVNDLKRGEVLLNSFVVNTAHLYGQNIVSLNVHNLKHLVDCVKRWGPLWGWSCFPFESFNGEIKKSVHGTGNVSRQILWAFQAQKRIMQMHNRMKESSPKNFVSDLFEGRDQQKSGQDAFQCKIIKLRAIQTKFDTSIRQKLQRLLSCSDENEFLTASKIIRNGFYMYSRKCSKVKKQNSFTIALERKLTSGEMAVEVEEYLFHKESKHVLAVGRLLKLEGGTQSPYSNHIQRLEYSDQTVVKAEFLREPMMIVTRKEKIYGALFQNHFERD